MRIITWDSLGVGDEAMHVAYVTDSSGKACSLHGHDFYELFWVDAGRGTQTFGEQGDREMSLHPGVIGFVGPGHQHRIESMASSEKFAFINIAFPASAWLRLRDGYQLDQNPLFRESDAEPPTAMVAREFVRAVRTLFHEMIHAPRNELSRDSFVLSVARRTGADFTPAGGSDGPTALRHGMLTVSLKPDLLRQGASALAHEVGCSIAHLSRLMRAEVGMTPSQWILGERLRRAERLLVATNLSIAEVALEAGFENLSHFHRRFREHHRETPLKFRKSRAQAVI